jgi:hypothetical protein
MGNSWLQRLTIRGPARAVTAFKDAAVSSAKPQYVTMKPVHRRQRLSFEKLRDALSRVRAERFKGQLEEPWDLVVDPGRRLRDGSLELTYKFQLSEFEIEDLIAEVSRLHPRLCFVVGCVAPDVDEQSSQLIHRGRSWRWRLTTRRREAIRRKFVPEETGDDDEEVFWGEVRADWAFMDEVVTHRRPKIDVLIVRASRLDAAVTRRYRPSPPGASTRPSRRRGRPISAKRRNRSARGDSSPAAASQ